MRDGGAKKGKRHGRDREQKRKGEARVGDVRGESAGSMNAAEQEWSCAGRLARWCGEKFEGDDVPDGGDDLGGKFCILCIRKNGGECALRFSGKTKETNIELKVFKNKQ